MFKEFKWNSFSCKFKYLIKLNKLTDGLLEINNDTSCSGNYAHQVESVPQKEEADMARPGLKARQELQ